jgi:uncharacterized membrane protein YfcA
MDYAVIILVTLLASALTFFSGFGLGTLLLPAFLLFFPAQVAVAATAVVHLANNLFKACLMGKKADYSVVVRFAVPAAAMAILGAWLLDKVSGFPVLARYELWGHTFAITPIKLLLAALMAAFSMLELWPRFEKLGFPPQLVPVGGAISGFFGGLTGHQGALRSAFLVRLGLEKEVFIGTTVITAVIIDIARLTVYGVTFFEKHFSILAEEHLAGILACGMLSALIGTFSGFYLIKKVTLGFIQKSIGFLLILYSLTLALGLI